MNFWVTKEDCWVRGRSQTTLKRGGGRWSKMSTFCQRQRIFHDLRNIHYLTLAWTGKSWSKEQKYYLPSNRAEQALDGTRIPYLLPSLPLFLFVGIILCVQSCFFCFYQQPERRGSGWKSCYQRIWHILRWMTNKSETDVFTHQDLNISQELWFSIQEVSEIYYNQWQCLIV